MRKVALIFVLLVTLAFVPHGGIAATADAPHEIAGFALGDEIGKCKDRLDMNSAVPVQHSEYLTEFETKDFKDIDGFKIGYIDFATCSTLGKIVAIKMKYADSNTECFNKLLELFKKKFGDPQEWQGDAFHTFLAWKWAFKDKSGNRISMILEHGREDDVEHTSGNTVKLTNWSLIESERKCYEAKHPEDKSNGNSGAGKKPAAKSPSNYEQLIPR